MIILAFVYLWIHTQYRLDLDVSIETNVEERMLHRGSSQGKINPFFFSVANTSNGSKIYPQTPNGSK